MVGSPFKPRRRLGVDQNSFFGRSATGGRNAGVKISSMVGVRGKPSASHQNVDRTLQAGCIDIAETNLGDLRTVHLVLERRVEPFALDFRR
jgi:hypothetical protein